jgi:hypothetical protein
MQQQDGNPGFEIKQNMLPGKHVLSMARDVPILLAVRDSTFINRHQIENLVSQTGKPEHWKNRNNRIRRLISPLGQLVVYPQCFPYPGRVFSISREGLRTLELAGMGLLSVTSGTEFLENVNQIPHFLGLNAIQIELKKAFNIANWYGDRYLKSMNIAVGKPTAKDYDSVAFVANPANSDNPIRIGIEYERVLKSKERYAEIRKNLSVEEQIDGLIYFADNDLVANQLAAVVYSQALPICIVTTNELYRLGSNCSILTVRDRQVVRWKLGKFIDALLSKKETVG